MGMSEASLSFEPGIETAARLGAFFGVLVAMALWQALAPRRVETIDWRWRWTNNLALVALNAALLRLAFPVTTVGFALLAEARGWGAFNLPELSAPGPVAIVLSIILLDLAIYLQHALFHAVPALWRLHRMHHADLEFDVTTGIRFHPLEIVLSQAIRLAVVAAIGAPALAVLVFEVVLNATAMFNHANISLPGRLDRVLRWIVVTPDMHRVHHSVLARETNSNFGFNLPWWDHLLGTYRAQPQAGHLAMTIGLAQFRDRAELRLDRMLLQPWREDAGRSQEEASP